MLDRTTPPAYQEIGDFHLLKTKTVHLDNGLPVHVLSAGKLPILRIELIFSKQAVERVKPSLPFFTLKMLAEGTKAYNSQQITEYVDQYGAFLDFNQGQDRVGMSLYCLRRYLPPLLALLRSMLTSPTFPESELESLKHVTKQNLLINQQKNTYLAGRKFRELLFGASHPYGMSLSEEILNQIQVSDLRQQYQEMIDSQYFDITLAGEKSEELIPQINQYFGQHQVQKSPLANDASQEFPDSKGLKHLVERPESIQSTIRIGRLMFSQTHPDYFYMQITNEIFGGYFGSRLMKNIREEKGYTYGIHSTLTMQQQVGFLTIGTDVKSEFVEATIAEIAYEARRLQTELISEAELSKVKNYILGSFLGSITNPFDLLDIFKSVYFNNLSDDFYEQYLQSIRSITPDDILYMANKYLSLDDMLEVVAGRLT